MALRIANAHGVPGTASAVVLDARGRPCLLTNYHVVFGGSAPTDGRLWAIHSDEGDPDFDEAVCLGRASAGRIGPVTFEQETVFVDCALVELADQSPFPTWLRRLVAVGPSVEVAPAEPGATVFKDGATTGITHGTMLDISYPDHPFIVGRPWSALGQLLIESRDTALNFSADGDSGAALFDERGQIIGLLWGSNANGQGIACPIEPVLNCLGIASVHASPSV